MSDKNRIIIFDTTMRDGEQSPGASMSLEEKLQISRVFDEKKIFIKIRSATKEIFLRIMASERKLPRKLSMFP